MTLRSTGARVALVFCFFAAQFCAAADAPIVPNIRNFHQVTDRLFRGGQPSPQGLQELGALGIKQVIDLRERGPATSFEEEQLKKLGIKYVNIPFRELSAPTDDQIKAVLKLLESGELSTFIHCRRGKDRTGTVIACYRIQHDGWDNQRALHEAKLYGMSGFERSMQHYVLHFAPAKGPALLPILGH
ncbi:MAG: fused DSP-PTPase phosphatase/NAD kinase-like protein [Bryobacteraceae bacterium]